jgi:hypothetical protein
MRYYLIFQKSTKIYLGFTNNKKDLRLFLTQRGSRDYKIIKYSDKNISNVILKNIEGSSELRGVVGKYLVFDHEEEYFGQVLMEYITELEAYSEALYYDLKYIRFTKKEKRIIKEAFKEIFCIIGYLTDSGGYIDEGDFLKLNKFMKRIIS